MDGMERDRDDHNRRLLTKLEALREAWLDLPWIGVVPKGAGAFMQRLVNAVTDIVDPEQLAKLDPEAKRRGDVASLKSQLEYKQDSSKVAEEWLASDMDACRRLLEKTRTEVVELERQLAEIGAAT